MKTKKMLKVPAGSETCAPQSQSGGAKNSACLRAVNVPHDNEMWDTKFLGLSVASRGSS